VNYETDELALRFVRDATAASQGKSVQIVLVDNSEKHSSKKLFDLIRAENPDVLCVRPPRNLGYFGGASFGFNTFLSTGQGFDWVIVSNVDVEFHSPGFFANLGTMEPMEDVAVVAPSILSTLSHHDQNPFIRERPSRTRMRFYQLLYRSYHLLNIYEVLAKAQHLAGSAITANLHWLSAVLRQTSGQMLNQGTGMHDRIPIYAPHGACIVFSKAFFARGGSLEVPFFLYGEEIYIAETARSLGLQVIYETRLQVRHDEHQSTGRGSLFLSRQAAKYLRETTDYLVDTYFS
jgi:GT2 family glycosyltransferase